MQYHVYWVQLDPTQGSEIAKTRPCVVASPDELNAHLSTVVVIPLTSALHGYPFRTACVVAGRQGELAVDQIRTVDKSRLNPKALGRLSDDEIAALQNVLAEMFCR
jgi:mRNA interferase MazF